ncbi:primosomal protein N' family DNA-binding protein [Cryobacterium tepidiphilum]|uniref:Probable replication restart protein PriA n=1 Tax=Cryobacterium tepidiphilum TaxID=2486026 RepID=A0A3M8LLZ9_9MICO|nr:primosomal protein N' [Cryobacterium tepidiphilum]RNE66543.1 primosomal protein N' [Cryobacterium tepidiphilum]
MTHTGLVARVLIDSPLPQLDHLFDYAVPDELAAVALPGVRVKVPFGSSGRVMSGYLIDLVPPDATGSDGEALFHGALSPLESVVSPARVLTGEVWTLARALADRAAGNASDIIRLAVPPRRVRVEKAWLAQAADAADAAGTAAPTCDSAPAVTVPAVTVPAFADYPPGAVAALVADGRRAAVAAVPEPVQLPGGETVGQWALTLAELGVAALAAGRSAILAVPDYRDQDQLQAALEQLAPAGSVRRVDARQSDPDRYRDFLACLDPVPRIIIGNRSAVYAPAHELGLIALWDDGDPLYAEPLSPYVHARDAALVRQQQSGCALVFLGHARSVEVERLVEIGWFDAVAPARSRHPRVIPTELQAGADARGARIPSAAWGAARDALQHGPVLVQVASPGYAPVLACTTCRHSARCTRCQGPLGLASAGATPACRWCGALAAGWHCPLCEGTTYRLVTVGSGRTAEELGRAFPGVRVIVADGDHIVQHVGASPALVIATRGAEPLAPGGYRAVLLLDGERLLARESLRVGEDCLRWWSNAAALAAPGASVMLIGVGGLLARSLSLWQPERYSASELADRRSLRFPPAVRAASVTGTAPAVETALAGLAGIAGVDVLGPVGADRETVRAIVRLPYSAGDEVAIALKAAIVRAATGRRPAKGGGYRPPPTLKVRFDDPELL